MRSQVNRQVAPASYDSYDANCGWRAPLASVGSGADVGAGAAEASALRESSIRPWPGDIVPSGDSTYVWVYFSGGGT